MRIWAIADLHLAFATPDKNMEFFGPVWNDYENKIKKNWKEKIGPEDLVLIPGDISWAMTLEQAMTDLRWIDALPGKKVILKGNHDYWWASANKMKAAMPPSIRFISNDVFTDHGVTIGGSRLWDTNEYSFASYIQFQDNPRARKEEKQDPEKIYIRELERLEISLSQLDPHATTRIALTHYPPISATLTPSRASKILEKYNVEFCIFGHLHNVKKEMTMFGEKNGISYLLTSCDYLNFDPIFIKEV